MSLPDEDLPMTRIKRTYKCKLCEHKTTNPRHHLRHRRDDHNDSKVRLVKCLFCLYACQYRQKLNRHLRLVHHRNPDLSFISSPTGVDGSFMSSSTSVNYTTPVEDDINDQPLDLSFPDRFKQLIKYLASVAEQIESASNKIDDRLYNLK